MRRKRFLALLWLGLSLPIWAQPVRGADESLLQACEATIDAALTAYNARDSQAFFQNFGRGFPGGDDIFQSYYVRSIQPKFGDYRSRQLLPARSVFGAPVGILVYQAQFSQRPATLSVNFYQQDGTWKLQQIRIDP